MMKKILLGKGVLNWDRVERQSDRYGSVRLFVELDSKKGGVKLNKEAEGKHGQLIAIVEETRQSSHIGDLFHGFRPSTPNVGDEIILGEGKLFFDHLYSEELDDVGVKPVDADKTTFWLEPKALYRVHEQTVSLYFIFG